MITSLYLYVICGGEEVVSSAMHGQVTADTAFVLFLLLCAMLGCFTYKRYTDNIFPGNQFSTGLINFD